ncbi:hypothetical protein GMOD_00007486 [Pyrenophora seminiperda CCB06]|uniref:Uncharacterized protein n=1 Tax=Pyrenophora seminiperda CCB06 TaxID=1302712 RepID=A0A3M7MDG4_9PLEO|nr:hypothetical protein GMOD_00007486 [Pyrenophora seminiperda CCB06]
MFMRLRGHTCIHCISIDEAHYKRHYNIAEQLRTTYDSCGEVNWTIVPPGSDSTLESDQTHDSNHTLADTLSSKRERKDAKRLARAASRSKVITQDEIKYIDTIIHSSHNLTDTVNEPRNPEEVEEIEKQLRHHAHIYNNSQVGHKELTKLAKAPVPVCVDFDAEMSRILGAFRISELLKRNTKTRGLQGKDLTTLLAVVDRLKRSIVEDIIQVRRDEAEARMRRAGYLRYTSKASYEIIEERYTDKDWKAGGKYMPIANVPTNAAPTNEVARPRVWDDIPRQQLADAHNLPQIMVKSDDSEISLDTSSSCDNASIEAPEVEAPPTWTAQDSEGLVAEPNDTAQIQPVTSKKKRKAKKSRQAKPKNKKLTESEKIPDLACSRAKSTEGATDDNDAFSAVATSAQALEPLEKTILASTPTTMPTKKYEKHMDWLGFMRHFMVDQLSDPSLMFACIFENNGIPDCPFHDPYWHCADPMQDQCHLVYPTKNDFYSIGPYNRIRAEKTMALYEADDRTKGGMMLVDEDMIAYLMVVAKHPGRKGDPSIMPMRLAREYVETAVGRCIHTPLTEQQLCFQELQLKNKLVKEPVTEDVLQDIQGKAFTSFEAPRICYCRQEMPSQMSFTKDIIFCSYRDCMIGMFRRSCVGNMGVEKVSRWYCGRCAHEMRARAHDALHHVV